MRTLLLTTIFSIVLYHAKAQQQDPWTAYMTPAQMHQMLAKFSGNFTMEITMWMAPGQEPMKATVPSSNKMVLGGRFLEMTQTGKMMGMDYHSITTIGFNNSDQQFALTTFTNMGTGILSLHGGWNETTKTANLRGQITNPVTKKPIQVRQQISFPDNNTLLIENFDQEEGGTERKSIQYKLSRTK